MATFTRTLAANWYPGAALHFTVLDHDGATLVARTAMVEVGTGGRFRYKHTAWDNAWAGTIVYDDGALEVHEEISPVVNIVQVQGSEATLGVSPGGSGADTVTLTINDENDDPIPDADVWVSGDAGGTNVVAGTLQTNSDGQVTFLLDDGATYYLWVQKDGTVMVQGELFTAAAD